MSAERPHSRDLYRAPEGFDPLSPSFLRDPFAVLKVARESAPVFYYEPLDVWAVTRYEDVLAVLTDFRTFSNAAIGGVPVPPEYQDRVPAGFFTDALIGSDPPEHTANRKVLQQAFSRGRMAAVAATIEGIVDDLLAGLSGRETCDLMADYFYEVSLHTIMAHLQISEEHAELCRDLADDMAAIESDAIKPMDPAERSLRWERLIVAREFLHDLVVSRKRAGGEDVIGQLANATRKDGRSAFEVEQLVTHLTSILFAGMDTTANLMGGMVKLLDGENAQRARILADPDLWPAAVEEGLRLRLPANAVFRKTVEPAVVGGVDIPSGAVLWVGISSTGHDSAAFERPSELDVEVKRGRHFGFGHGRHFCLGAPLARVEAPIALRRLYEAHPGLSVLPGAGEDYAPVLITLVLNSLEVSLR